MQSKNKLIRRVSVKEMDSVKVRQKRIGLERDMQLLERCNTLWDNYTEFRERRARAIRFTFDDQWGDLIQVNGKTMTQRQYIMRQGNAVIQTNQIKNKVDTIVGILVKEQNEPVCNARDREEQQYGQVMTAALQANCYKNKMQQLYILFMKDMCLGGLAVAHESYDDVSGPSRRLDTWTRYCNPNHIFFDSAMSDPLFRDMTIIGQFFDMSFEEACAMFAHSERDYSILRDIYHYQSSPFRHEPAEEATDKHEDKWLSFLTPSDHTKCRVFEVWTKESRPRIRLNDTNAGTEEIIDADDYAYRKSVREANLRRRELAKASGWSEEETSYIIGDGFGRDETERNGFFTDTYWYCRYLAPDGTILWEGESPYADRLHPFTICATPFVDGKIVGYMNDAIDHNIAINRALVLHDWLLRCQAKGVTVVPKAIVPKDVTFEDFARSWTSIDDMVFIEMKEGQENLMPKVFYGSAQTFNVSELVNTYSKLMENSTAVTGAMQGKTPYSGTSGALYAQMASNSSTPIASLLAQFHSFLEEMHTKKMKNIAAFYEPARFASIVGNIDSIFDNQNLNLNEVGDIEYDLSIKESTETPVYRFAINDTLKELLAMGAITPMQYLHYGYFPGTEGLYQEMQAQQAEVKAAQQGEMPGVSPDDLNQRLPVA